MERLGGSAPFARPFAMTSSISERIAHAFRKPGTKRLLTLTLAAGIPRLAAALLISNPDGDSYVYAEVARSMRRNLIAGSFSAHDLAGFWLPLYQFVAAAVSLPVNNTLYAAKMISAACGIGSCLLVYKISLRLTANRWLAYSAFAVAALNPLHILFSGFSMTDVPYGFLIMASLYAAIDGRWVWSGLAAMAAGWMRADAWILIFVLPLLQYVSLRKVSPALLLSTVCGPIVILIVYWLGTGNALAYFSSRNEYIRTLLASDSTLVHYSADRVLHDAGRLMYSINPIIVIAALLAVPLVFHIWRDNGMQWNASIFGVLVSLGFFSTSLCFLIAAYATNNQPQIWSRYGLVEFFIGLPVLAWIVQQIRVRRPVLTRSAISAAIVVFLFQWGLQFVDGAIYASAAPPQNTVARYLKNEYRQDSGFRVFSNDAAVRVLSGLPRDTFLTSFDMPSDRESFLKELNAQNVRFLLYEKSEGSLVKLFPELGTDDAAPPFKLVLHGGPAREHAEYWFYEVTQQ